MILFGYEDGDFIYALSDSMATDSDGNLMMRLSDHMAMDIDSGDLHMTSPWPSDDEDDW